MAGGMRKERTGVIVIRVAIWPPWSLLPREQSSGTQESYATRQSSSLRNELAPAASSLGIPRIDMEFAESYYSYKTAIFVTTGRLGGGLAGCILAFSLSWTAGFVFSPNIHERCQIQGISLGQFLSFM